jgi:hypothetical protein
VDELVLLGLLLVLFHKKRPASTTTPAGGIPGIIVSSRNWGYTLADFAVSGSRPDLVAPVPAKYQASALRVLNEILNPISDFLGRRVRITSGYRSPQLNDSVGGDDHSRHPYGEAVDFDAGGARANLTLFRAMVAGALVPNVGQVILYPAVGHIHAALPSSGHPRPTYQVHHPARGHNYATVADLTTLDRWGYY